MSQKTALLIKTSLCIFFAVLLLTNCIGKTTTNTTSEPASEITQPILKEEQEPEWLIIGGDRVYNLESQRKYKYYLKSEAENAIGIRLLINPKSKNIATSLEGIEQLVNLQRLSLLGLNLDELDYSPLKTLQNIKEITFECGNVFKMTKIPDLSFMDSKEKIKDIWFTNCALTNFDNIGFLPNLRFVEAWNTGALNNLKALDNLKYLETLRISTGYSIFHIEEIKSLTNLKELLLHGKQINLKGIENLTALEEIQFFESETRDNIFLSGLTNLQRLEITIRDQNPDMRFLNSMRNLQELEITIHDQNPDIQFLNNMKSLKKLIIKAHNDIWDNTRSLMPYQIIDLSPIGSLSQLNYLELKGFILQNIAVLDGLDSLKLVYVYYSILKNDSERTEKELMFYVDR